MMAGVMDNDEVEIPMLAEVITAHSPTMGTFEQPFNLS